MIKFEKNGFMLMFQDADEAVEWMIDCFENESALYNLIENYNLEFEYWANDNFTVTDLLLNPELYNYNSLREEWLDYLRNCVRHFIPEFEEIE